jgi:hypothetical protein
MTLSVYSAHVLLPYASKQDDLLGLKYNGLKYNVPKRKRDRM